MLITVTEPQKKRTMSFFDTYYFDLLSFIKTFSLGFKLKRVESEILRLRKKYDLCWRVIDKDGKVIERFYL